ncbi:hypothetical protein ACOMCU_18920 [Lysinibacillus sp. UGB7]|uniref:hypothetical protein n=1 Tax=Lysinibacillus sp. UGB7 TaxID=3411039 RepID=UPI003B7CDC2E
MIAQMKKVEFDALGDIALVHACFKPLILDYKRRMVQENSSIVKELFYKDLNIGHKALFIFHVYYDHAIESKEEFYWWSAYYMAQPKIWSAIKIGLQYFGDEPMYQLLEETEIILQRYHCPNTLEKFAVTREDLGSNRELAVAMDSLYLKFTNIAPLTVIGISNFIRGNHEIFVKIEH